MNRTFLIFVYMYILLFTSLVNCTNNKKLPMSMLLDSNISNNSIIEDIRPEEIAIMQYDSRIPLRDYWLVTAKWNKNYCDKHGHQYIYYTSKYTSTEDAEWCEKDVLASPWCKVKAMVQANEDFPHIKMFIYLDSDALISKLYDDLPLTYLLKLIHNKLGWNPEKKPLIFNQDGPCWWCTLIQKVGYNMCLNAGTVIWYRHDTSKRLLDDWWFAAMDSYETNNPIKRRYRIKWPWEQDRQMSIYNKSSNLIQVTSQPDRSMMQTNALYSQGWCLSHLPASSCFIAHYCEGAYSKAKLKKLYHLEYDIVDITILRLR